MHRIKKNKNEIVNAVSDVIWEFLIFNKENSDLFALQLQAFVTFQLFILQLSELQLPYNVHIF